MKLEFIFFSALLTSYVASAYDGYQFNYQLRAEDFFSSQGQIPREILLVSTNVELGSVKFYGDAFAEADQTAGVDRQWRRSVNKGYLQEAYIDISWSNFYLKVGRQAARWSESWVVPSLDVWTARKYERLFLDPLPQQLTHSSGALLTIVQSTWSLDFALMTEVAKDTYPEPYPSTLNIQDSESLNPGLRLKTDFRGFQSSFVAARAQRKNIFGFSGNYAFESWVPKVEFGAIRNDQVDSLIVERNTYFGSLGADLFLGDLTMTPQISVFDGENPYVSRPTQVLYYLATTYTYKKHEFQFLGYSNSVYVDAFGSLSYTYFFLDHWSLALLLQNYQGARNSITDVVEAQTGGNFYGIRLQFGGTLKKKSR